MPCCGDYTCSNMYVDPFNNKLGGYPMAKLRFDLESCLESLNNHVIQEYDPLMFHVCDKSVIMASCLKVTQAH